MDTKQIDRIITTSTTYARKNYLYVQEIGNIQVTDPILNSRENLDSFLFFIVLNGHGTVTMNDETFKLSSGDCAFIDCTKKYSHCGDDDEPWAFKWVHFYGKQAPVFYSQYSEVNSKPVFHPLNVNSFIAILDSLLTVQRSTDPAKELITHKYLTDLVTLICTENMGITDSHISIGKKFDHIRAFIDDHYREKLSLDLLSDKFYVSKFYLSREFKRVYGVNLINYISEKRVSQAKLMLRFTNKSVEQIGHETGFPDTGYFIKVFKKEETMTPLEYRKKWRD